MAARAGRNPPAGPPGGPFLPASGRRVKIDTLYNLYCIALSPLVRRIGRWITDLVDQLVDVALASDPSSEAERLLEALVAFTGGRRAALFRAAAGPAPPLLLPRPRPGCVEPSRLPGATAAMSCTGGGRCRPTTPSSTRSPCRGPLWASLYGRRLRAARLRSPRLPGPGPVPRAWPARAGRRRSARALSATTSLDDMGARPASRPARAARVEHFSRVAPSWRDAAHDLCAPSSATACPACAPPARQASAGLRAPARGGAGSPNSLHTDLLTGLRGT